MSFDNITASGPSAIRQAAEQRQAAQLGAVEDGCLLLEDIIGSIIFNRGKAIGLSDQEMADIQDHLDAYNGHDLRHIAAAAALVGNTLAEVLTDALAGKRV